MAMRLNITMAVTLILPDGSAPLEDRNGRGWMLPSRDWVKPFVTLELNDERDLGALEMFDLGVDVDDFILDWEIEA